MEWLDLSIFDTMDYKDALSYIESKYGVETRKYVEIILSQKNERNL